jgi:PAS domain S-box-containing protein
LVINSSDVTERVKRLQSLKEHKILLAEAQKIAKLGSWKWDPKNGKGLYWSDEMCRIYGVEPNNFNFNYQTFLKYTHEEDRERVHNIIKNAIEEKKSYSFVHKIIRPDQQIRTLLSKGKIMTDEEGNIIKVIGIEQDFTEHEKREKQLRTYSRRLRNLAARLEQTREQERTKLAHEIHEDLGQMLAVLKMDISRMSGKIEKKIAQEFMEIYNKHTSSILERINTIINSVQRITDELRPEVLDDLGYKDAIYWESKEFGNRQNVEVKFTSNISRSDDLDEKQSTALFRAFQEALKNVEKHANASKVRIELIKDNDAITLVIQDNGTGITNKKIESVSSHGIIGMRERIERLGGELTIKGGEGTTVTFRLPINRTG